jgi:hypothetical protein
LAGLRQEASCPPLTEYLLGGIDVSLFNASFILFVHHQSRTRLPLWIATNGTKDVVTASRYAITFDGVIEEVKL